MDFQRIMTLWLWLTSLGLSWNSNSLFTLCLTVVTLLNLFTDLQNGDSNDHLFLVLHLISVTQVKHPANAMLDRELSLERWHCTFFLRRRSIQIEVSFIFPGKIFRKTTKIITGGKGTVARTLHYNKTMTGSVPNHWEADIKKGHVFNMFWTKVTKGYIFQSQ